MFCSLLDVKYISYSQGAQTSFKSTALISFNWKDLKITENLRVQYKEITRVSCQDYAPSATDV